MKICIVTTIFPPTIGGPAVYSYEIAKRLAKNNEVHIVTYNGKKYEEIEKFFIHRVNVRTKIKSLSLILRVLKAIKLVKQVVKKYDIDVIFAQNPDLAGIPAYFVSKKYNKKMIMKFVGDWAWETAYRKKWTNKTLNEFYNKPKDNFVIKLMKKIEMKVVNSAKEVIVPSYYLKSILKKWPVKSKIKVIYNAVNLPRFKKINLNGKNIIAVGRFVPWKRFDDIIRIMPKINANLLIIGSGPQLQIWKKLVNELNINKKVKFLAKLDHEKTLAYIQASDALVLPSLYEGLSHVLLEAMALKTPVIASDVCGNTELVKGNGILVQPKNLKQLEQAIRDILNGKKNYTSEAYNFIKKNNTWHILIKKTLEILK